MKTKLTTLIGILLLLELTTQLVPIALLGTLFEFPDILREPASYALQLFRQHQSNIVSSYYIFMFSSILYLPLTALIKTNAQIKNFSPLQIGLFQFSGIATAIFQTIGFCRWIILTPFLSDTYFDTNTTEATKRTIELIYETMNHYAGMTIGEHLGFIAMGCWTILLTQLLEGKRWFRITGQLIGLTLIVATAEQFGGKHAELFGQLNFLANTLWSIWILILAILFFRGRV